MRMNHPMLIDQCLSTDEVTAVQVRLQINETVFRVTGEAKKHPNDHPDSETGEALAYARALRKLADRLETHAVHRIEAVQNGGPFSVMDVQDEINRLRMLYETGSA